MKTKLKNLSDLVARTNDLFYEKFNNIETLMGIMDKNLRNQGIKADAITIDCIALDKKIVFLIHDDKPDVVGIALGNKKGGIYSSLEYKLADISQAVIMRIMTENFT